MAEAKNTPNKGLRTTLIGIIVSALLAVVKALGGIFGHSYALIADAIESGADVFTSTMLWIGLKWSAKPADDNHPYGHGKAEALVALGISLALVIAAGIIIRDSVLHIMEPHKTPAPYTLIILVVVILTKELLYRFVLKTGTEINSGAVKADAFHHRSDAITSAAAFIGISIALIGGEGYEVADDFAALMAGGFIIYNACGIARPAIGELLDEALEPDLQEDISGIALSVNAVQVVQKCRSRKMGTGYHVDLHIWINGDLTVKHGHDIAHEVKDKIMKNVPYVLDVHIHVEPNSTQKESWHDQRTRK
ncbi:cation diffusion facilitator family transporter [Imperialibacter roseus]|uniref:Cation diffusion facilitator family transporter n=1 Tax=Imperialibacter roseus TaxID=1324217 RepID=A0ABZ0IS94_9BACT|nr:cation diffusion facilitator family transporter [Imperialibacter roseus]WOK07284.1 cation diffusion facilitator family transporter [Imperialibacter roseus]